VAAGDTGLVVVNIDDPEAPVQVASISGLSTTGYANGVAVSGTSAYVAYGSDAHYKGLAKYDISDPAHPVFVADVVTDAICRRVEVSGDYAYVANNTDGLTIVKVDSNTLVVQTDPPYAAGPIAYGVALSGPYAVVAGGAGGLSIINVSTPSSIPSAPNATVAVVKTAAPSANDDARDVVIYGSYAYVADDVNGLVAIRLWEDLQ
jgi:hypothetical protein